MNALIKAILACAVAMSPVAVVYAQSAGHDAHHGAASSATKEMSTSNVAWSEGVVRKVDKNTKKITIKHGDLKNLGMPPMTMAFQVQDASMLDKVKDGDPLRFVADQIGGKLTIVRLDVAK